MNFVFSKKDSCSSCVHTLKLATFEGKDLLAWHAEVKTITEWRQSRNSRVEPERRDWGGKFLLPCSVKISVSFSMCISISLCSHLSGLSLTSLLRWYRTTCIWMVLPTSLVGSCLGLPTSIRTIKTITEFIKSSVEWPDENNDLVEAWVLQ